jgi:iron(III) transport system permease protein
VAFQQGSAPVAAELQPRARPSLRLPAWEFSADRVLLVVTGTILAYLVVVPLAFLVYTSLQVPGSEDPWALTLDNYARVLGASNSAAIVLNSLLFALGGTVGAIALGTLLAWMVERTDAPLRSVTYATMFVSMALPGTFKVIGWIIMLGPRAGFLNQWSTRLFGPDAVFNIFTLGGMILVETLLWAPVVFLLVSGPLRQMDPSLEEAAQMSGADRLQVVRRVTYPLLTPAVLAVALLGFVRMLESFEVPALVGLPGRTLVLTSSIYLGMTRGLVASYEEPSAYAVLLMIPVAVGLYFYLRMTRHAQKFQVVTGKGFRPRIVQLGRARWLAGVVMVGTLVLLLLPMLALAWTSFFTFVVPPSLEALSKANLDNYAKVGSTPRLLAALWNTLVTSLVSATVVMLLTTVAAWVAIRSRIRSRQLLDYLSIVPLTFPGIVLGLALLEVYLRVPIPIYNTLWILMIAYITRYEPYAMRYASAGLLQIHAELEESAAVSGARWWQLFSRVTMPLMMPALIAGWAFVFLHAAIELSTSVLLAGPRSQVAAVFMFQLWQEGQVNEIGAFAVVLSVPLVILSLLLLRASQRYGIQR